MNNTVQEPDPVLRKVALEVPLEEIESEHIKDVIRRMKEGIRTHDDGGVNVGYAVAIAAPQIGESYRIFVVAGIAYLSHEERKAKVAEPEDKVFINPVITKTSSNILPLDEGCRKCIWRSGAI